ncbi:MAG: 30S ribosomal protein S7 [Candidatus Diapherotrites archaeon]|nr:30S ribosomal protein S7 [Candidatus Diapherotrites archaeon]
MSSKTDTKAKEREILVFGKWSTKDIKINDPSLAPYISLKGKVIPHTFGKAQKKKYRKEEKFIVERLVNKIMRSGQGKRKLSGKFIRGRDGCGKKLQALEIVEKAFEIVEKRTKENPIQILVRAIENSAPREDTTRIQRGGISYTVAVDVAPTKRLDEALKNIALATFQSSFDNPKPAHEALAEELILAANGDKKSFSIRRRDEIERIAKASR